VNLNPASLPGGEVGLAYDQTLYASGGAPSYSFSVTAGSIPGLNLDSDGHLNGMPTTAGTFDLTVMAVDKNMLAGERVYPVVVSPGISYHKLFMPFVIQLE
jgi:hypothetical protein